MTKLENIPKVSKISSFKSEILALNEIIRSMEDSTLNNFTLTYDRDHLIKMMRNYTWVLKDIDNAINFSGDKGENHEIRC